MCTYVYACVLDAYRGTDKVDLDQSDAPEWQHVEWSLLVLSDSESYNNLMLLHIGTLSIIMWLLHHRVSIWPRNVSTISSALLTLDV